MLPGLVFFQPSEYIFPTEKPFSGPLSLPALLEAADKHYPYYSIFLEDIEDLDDTFLKDLSIPTKAILLKPTDRVPLWWKALTSFYRNRIEVIFFL